MCQLMKNVNVSLRIISDSIIIALKNNTTIISSIAKLGGGDSWMNFDFYSQNVRKLARISARSLYKAHF